MTLCVVIEHITVFSFYLFFSFLLIPPPPRSTLFPYTTLFRSRSGRDLGERKGDGAEARRKLFVRQTRHVDLRVFLDRKSTRLNSSHANISYAVFCLKKKKKIIS